MPLLTLDYWTDHVLIALALFAALAFVVSSVADYLRQKRKDIEAVGFMPWTAISVFSALFALMAGALAFKS